MEEKDEEKYERLKEELTEIKDGRNLPLKYLSGAPTMCTWGWFWVPLWCHFKYRGLNSDGQVMGVQILRFKSERG